MQINANSGVSALAYQKTQNTQPIQSQSASTNTLQSDKVTFSANEDVQLNLSSLLLPDKLLLKVNLLKSVVGTSPPWSK